MSPLSRAQGEVPDEGRRRTCTMRKMQQAGTELCVLEETTLVTREERFVYTIKILIDCHTK